MVLFAVPIGIGVGVAARAATWRGRILAPLIGYLIAAALHVLWNVAAVFVEPSAFVAVYFLVFIPVAIGCWGVVMYLRQRERRVLAESLPKMAQAGWIAKSEVELLTSVGGRRGWRRAVRRRAGTDAEKAVADYQVAVTELAFLLRRGADSTRESVLVAALNAARERAARQTPEWRVPADRR